MKLAIALAAGFFVFYKWMGMVGNPHVVETVLGLFFATVAMLGILWILRKRR